MRAWAIWTLAWVATIAASGCASPGPEVHWPSAGAAASTWRYEVALSDGARQLSVDAWLPPRSLSDLVVRLGAERFVVDAQVRGDDGWRALTRRGAAFHAPECAEGCHVRYRFDLARAAAALRDVDGAIAWGSVIEASPSVWLLHPTLAPPGARYRLHVRTGQDARFVAGTFAAGDGPPDAYQAEASTLAVAPYAAFGAFRMHHVEAMPGATIDVAIAPADYTLRDEELVEWVRRSARTMARFFGCFPLERVLVLVVPADGGPHTTEVSQGETMGDGGASIVVEVGEHADAQALAGDWVLPHEMAHLSIPSVSPRHHWIEEGLAVYVQPVARARAGEIQPVEVWREFAAGMPKGAPKHGSGGLDDTPSWASTYWGGATFCLLADIEMRRRSGNRVGLEDALRGLAASGGSVAQMWDFPRLLETADAAVGLPVLVRMDQTMGTTPWRVDLPRVFRELGVIVKTRHARGGDEQEVTLVDSAPLAAARRAITDPFPANAPGPTACRIALPDRMAER